MGLKRHILILTALVMGTASLYGQFRTVPPESYRDFGFMAGISSPMTQGYGNDLTLAVTYARYGIRGLGFRTGAQLTPNMAGTADLFAIPIALSYRTSQRSTSERLISGAVGTAATLWDNIYWRQDNPARGLLGAFIASTFSQAEFLLGITNGAMTGKGSAGRLTPYPAGTDLIGQQSDYYLSIDAGTALNYRIGHCDLKIMPTFHYVASNTFCTYRSYGADLIAEPLRWYFSLMCGITFRM